MCRLPDKICSNERNFANTMNQALNQHIIQSINQYIYIYDDDDDGVLSVSKITSFCAINYSPELIISQADNQSYFLVLGS